MGTEPVPKSPQKSLPVTPKQTPTKHKLPTIPNHPKTATPS
jgi:hypothetical protein